MELISKRCRLLAKEFGSEIEKGDADLTKNEAITGTIVTLRVSANFQRPKILVLFVFTFAHIFLFSQSKEIDSVLASYQDKLTVALKYDNKQLAADYYNIIGQHYFQIANYAEAIRVRYSELKLREAINDKKGIANVLQDIGGAYFWEGNYPESLKNYFEALRLRLELRDLFAAAQTYASIGDAYQKTNSVAALNNYSKGLEIYSKPGAPVYGVTWCYNGMAETFKYQGDSAMMYSNEVFANEKYKAALEKFLQVVSIREQKKLAFVEEALINAGSIYTRLKEFNKGKRLLQRGIPMAVEKGTVIMLPEGYQALAIIDSAEGNYKQAFENYKNYVLYRDILSNEDNARKNLQVRMQYEFDKKEDSLRQKQVLTQARLDSQKKQKKYYLVGSVLLGLLSLVVFLNFRNQKKINRLKDDAHAKEKAELELQSLRAQLNPHFMFNSLNAIQELILKEENEKSQSYLARFAKLLRMLLENADRPFIPLQREIDFLHLYLSLENLRIPDLKFSIDIDKGVDTEKTVIPNMILQPYIENAIWHGLSHKENDKQLRIKINQTNGITSYEIEDNGVGRKRSAELKSLYRQEHKSKGMELLSKRFRLLANEYGSEIETTVNDVATGKRTGTIVTIRVPQTFKAK